MKVLIFGATGMVGQGLLRECLLDPAITTVQVVGRTPVGVQHAKLQELLTRTCTATMRWKSGCAVLTPASSVSACR